MFSFIIIEKIYFIEFYPLNLISKPPNFDRFLLTLIVFNRSGTEKPVLNANIIKFVGAVYL